MRLYMYTYDATKYHYGGVAVIAEYDKHAEQIIAEDPTGAFAHYNKKCLKEIWRKTRLGDFEEFTLTDSIEVSPDEKPRVFWANFECC